VCFLTSVINFIYLKQLILLYIKIEVGCLLLRLRPYLPEWSTDGPAFHAKLRLGMEMYAKVNILALRFLTRRSQTNSLDQNSNICEEFQYKMKQVH
jgi:hypothetical protein